MSKKNQRILATVSLAAIIIIILNLSIVRLRHSSDDNAKNSSNQNNTATNTVGSDKDYADTEDYGEDENLSPIKSTDDIKGYSKTVKILSANEGNNILTVLDDALRRNSISSEITDAEIRAGSYSQKLVDQSQLQYYTTFIVDIPSLRQSYVVEDYFSPLPATEETDNRDYDIMVHCPNQQQTIYTNFNCQEATNQ